MDQFGWFIATTHQMVGHEVTAALIGMPAGDKSACVLCQYEADPSPGRRQAVIDAIGRSPDDAAVGG